MKISRHQLRGIINESLHEGMPHVNKYHPGSLLAQVVRLLDDEGLEDASKAVRNVSTIVEQAWSTRGQLPEPL